MVEEGDDDPGEVEEEDGDGGEDKEWSDPVVESLVRGDGGKKLTGRATGGKLWRRNIRFSNTINLSQRGEC